MKAKEELIAFAPECYFKNPITGQTGWSIHYPKVYATCIEEAALAIRSLPHFDCFIDIEFDKFNDDPAKQYSSGASVSFSVEHRWNTPNHAEIIAALEKRLEVLRKDFHETRVGVVIFDTQKIIDLL